jgi:hypothetical protein
LSACRGDECKEANCNDFAKRRDVVVVVKEVLETEQKVQVNVAD